MIASYHGHKEIIKILLEHNADIYIQDCFGKRAIDRAKDNTVIKILQNEEEKLNTMTAKSPKLTTKLSSSSLISQNNVIQDNNNNMGNTSALNNLTNNAVLNNYQIANNPNNNSNVIPTNNVECNNAQNNFNNVNVTSNKNIASTNNKYIASVLKKSNSKAALNTSVETKKSASPIRQTRFADIIISSNEKDKVFLQFSL